jgi:hypothetical protein
MIQLTNAVVPFDDDIITIEDGSKIAEMYIDHSLANSDCTRVTMADGNVFQVKESVDEIQQMIDNEKEQQ